MDCRSTFWWTCHSPKTPFYILMSSSTDSHFSTWPVILLQSNMGGPSYYETWWYWNLWLRIQSACLWQFFCDYVVWWALVWLLYYVVAGYLKLLASNALMTNGINPHIERWKIQKLGIMCCIVCFYYGSVNQWFLVPDDRDTRFEVYFYYHSSSLPFSFDDVFVYFQLRELSGEKINFYFFSKLSHS